ncbi:hypothetical protein QOZ80_6BG0483730 [Eleusine coracana subsp. coracana]|nr:hypothetical protein QOZ80_6BG0483730 [Eleusine coracana subsp. coracana]
MVRAESRKKKAMYKPSSAKTRRKKISKKRFEWEELKWTTGMRRSSIMAYPKSPDQDICYICGVEDHEEHFCPYNYIYGRYFSDTCIGICHPAQHTISTRTRHKFLQCFIRVSNLPPEFNEWDLEEHFSPFGPLLMWDVPRFTNEICGCTSEILMNFGVVVFKYREDGERAINKLNGYEVGGRKLRIDWAYPSIV